MSNHQRSIVNIRGTVPKHPNVTCLNCHKKKLAYLSLVVPQITPEDHRGMMSRGFIREEKEFYCCKQSESCCHIFNLRARALEFEMSKSQKKTMRRWNNFIEGKRGISKTIPEGLSELEEAWFKPQETKRHLRIVFFTSPSYSQAKLDLYNEYQRVIHGDKKPDTASSFQKFICVSNLLHEKFKRYNEKGEELEEEVEEEEEIREEKEHEEKKEETKDEIEVIDEEKNEKKCKEKEDDNEGDKEEEKEEKKEESEEEKEGKGKNGEGEKKEEVEKESNKYPETGHYHLEIYLDGQLIGVSNQEVLDNSMNSNYFFFNPIFKPLSLGVISALWEIQKVRDLHQAGFTAMKYYCIGAYIHDNLRMRYKLNYGPVEILCPHTRKWVNFNKNIQNRLENHEVRLCDDDWDIENEFSQDLLGYLAESTSLCNLYLAPMNGLKRTQIDGRDYSIIPKEHILFNSYMIQCKYILRYLGKNLSQKFVLSFP